MPSPNDGPFTPLLPAVKTYITTNDPATGKAVLHSSPPVNWSGKDSGNMGFNLVYTTQSTTPSLNDDADIAAHSKLVEGNEERLSSEGSVCRMVDFAPGYSCVMHRTQSLDYGVVLEGNKLEMVLDSGEVHRLNKGDVCVQRATMHQWRNASETEWARMLFVLLGVDKVVVGGKELGDEGFLPPVQADDAA